VGWIADGPPPPHPLHAGSGHERAGVVLVDAAPLFGHTVEVYRQSRLATCIPMCKPFSAWWFVAGPERPPLGVIDGGKNIG
jgi:hypothetical protein